ncbi:hypothetical protein [Novosphingobium sp. 17-62-19]|uniref:hypothetical protein n=1 Tax=Novosphingobium sp. 17-62-19 TaxID=1970406 RepID=UPI0025FC80A5|nr:hypothetical protein [Novosphingobium sp. 17-62-19]HQS95053.1 hypothetical protein [Novosphingobium sp.]
MIFSTPMVMALLAGRKTQTRRLLPEGRQPRLKVGDRVYVRETFRIAPNAAEGWPHEAEPCPGWIDYAAGGSHYCFAPDYFAVLEAFGKIPVDWDNLPQRWRPSRIAPRWTSRMYLTITDVRVQQLLYINEHDCIAEGLEEDFDDGTDSHGRSVTRSSYHAADYLPWLASPREAYADLWDQLNTKPGTRWDDNPRVVAYTFTVTRRNIDVLPMAPGYFAETSPAHPSSAHPEPVEGVEGRQPGLDPQGREAVPHRQPGLDPGRGFSSSEAPITPRALIEGHVPPHIAAHLIRASDLPQPVRKRA